MTVIKIKEIFIILIFCFVSNMIYSQNKKPVFLMFDKNMLISNVDEKVKLKFGLQASDNESCIYNFEINNASKVGEGFDYFKFREIKNPISEEELKKGEVLTLEELSKYDFCDLQYLFADTDKLYLIKKIDGIIYKYKLSFWSSQRGWSTVKQ